MGPNRTSMPTMGLSHFLPALMFLRSASKPGLRDNRIVLARLAAKFSPRRTHAFGQSKRPADPKRHTDVIARLKTIGAKCARAGICMAYSSVHFIILGLKYPFSPA